jgi:hypothetical protein
MTNIKIVHKNKTKIFIQGLFITCALLLSNSILAACIDVSGLNLIQIIEAANKQQAAILKTVKSQQSANKAVPRLIECRTVKHKANVDMKNDAPDWARKVAKGDKRKEKTLLAQSKTAKKSYTLIMAEFIRIKEEAKVKDLKKLIDTIELNVKPTVTKKADFIKNPESLLIGSWYLLHSYTGTNLHKPINSEIQFINKKFAVINSNFLGRRSSGKYKSKPSFQELVNWDFVFATKRIPDKMKMGMTSNELKSYIYVQINVIYIGDILSEVKAGKIRRNRKVTKFADFKLLLNPDKGEILIKNFFNSDKNSINAYQKFYTKKAMPKENKAYLKKWEELRQESLDKNLTLLTELCDFKKYPAMNKSFCKKAPSVLKDISITIKTKQQSSKQKLQRQYIFQPIKIFTDAAPLPTKLPYESLLNYHSSMAFTKCKEDKKIWFANREKEGYSDSVWTLKIRSNTTKADPGYSQQEYIRYSTALLLWNRGQTDINGKSYGGDQRVIVHLRKDGVFGLSWSPSYTTIKNTREIKFELGKEYTRMYYDPSNRWKYDGKNVNLYWQNSKHAFKLSYIKLKFESVEADIIANYSELYKTVKFYAPEQGSQYWKNSKNKKMKEIFLVEHKASKAQQCNNIKPKKITAKILPVTKSTFQNKLTGCWKWNNGAHITISSNGEANNGAAIGKWKAVNAKKGRYEITWPPFIDFLVLSGDGKKLSGINIFGIPITATRLTGELPGLNGKWLWSNGLPVTIQDTKAIGGGFNGSVSSENNKWIFKWPLVDNIVVAKNGLSLSLKNQLGALNATRDVDCKGKK